MGFDRGSSGSDCGMRNADFGFRGIVVKGKIRLRLRLRLRLRQKVGSRLEYSRVSLVDVKTSFSIACSTY